MISIRNNSGQGTAEYAILIALVVAAIIAMQTYAQRSLQAKVRDAGIYLTETTGAGADCPIDDSPCVPGESSAGANIFADLGTTNQYEPYYTDTQFQVQRFGEERAFLDSTKDGVGASSDVTTNRASGYQKSTYSPGNTIRDDGEGNVEIIVP